MNIFVGNFSIKEPIEYPDLDFDIVQTGEKSYFIMGADESVHTSVDATKFLEANFGKLVNCDISMESEDSLEIISSEYELGVYECVSFEGPEVSFGDILERFSDSVEAISIREAEQSEIYGNKIVRIDFMY